MTLQETANTEFSIGNAISTTFSLIGRNFVPFFALAFVAALPPVILSQSFLLGTHIAVASTAWGLSLAGSQLLTIALDFLLQAAITYISFLKLSGKSPSIGDALIVALRSFFPLIGIVFLFYLALAIGLVLFVIPFFFVLTIFFVIVPAYVVEKPGIFGAFDRSANLTLGHRWPLFLLLVISFVAFIVLGVIVLPFNGALVPSNVAHLPISSIAVTTLVRMMTLVWQSTLATAVYYLLRVSKDGIGIDQLAAVFE